MKPVPKSLKKKPFTRMCKYLVSHPMPNEKKGYLKPPQTNKFRYETRRPQTT